MGTVNSLLKPYKIYYVIPRRKKQQVSGKVWC